MDPATKECLLSLLSEIIPIAAVTALLTYLGRQAAKKLAEAAIREALKKILKPLLTRVIPILGIAYLILQILRAICRCWTDSPLPKALCDAIDRIPF